MKRFLSILLVLCMAITLLPVGILAEEPDASTQSSADVGGVGSVGELISNEIYSQKQSENGENSNISDLTVEDGIARVTFLTEAAECDVVVALYDENNEARMLASGTAVVYSGDSEVEIELSGEIPETFTATAYMLERNTHSPMCEAFTTLMYTSRMQEFLEKTAEDYDEELVLNLDENIETNFAVYDENTVRVNQSEGVSVRENGDGTYVLSNATSEIKALEKGDKFSYTYSDGTVLLVKIGSVKVSGDTVTLSEADDAQLQDFFDYVKIEGTTDSRSEAKLDTSDMDEGVSLVDSPVRPAKLMAAKSFDKDGSYGDSFSVNLENKNIKGSLTVGYEVNLKIYITGDYKYISLTTDFTQSISVTLTLAKVGKEITLKLPRVEVAIIPGVYARLNPRFVAEANIDLKWTGEIKSTVGFAYDSDTGFVNKCSSPSCDSKLEISGKMFLGLKVSLDLTIISDKIASAGIESKLGAELSAKQRIDNDSSGSKKHECSACITGRIDFVFSLTAKANFIKFEVEKTFLENKTKIKDFYFSETYNDFGWGTCPYISYKVTLTVQGKDGNPVSDGIIECSGLDYRPKLSEKGVTVFYLPNGSYNIHVEAGGQNIDKSITVHDTEKELHISLAQSGSHSGKSGTFGDNLTWTLDSKGKLTISGIGDMADVPWDDFAPWWYEDVISVEIKSGVTSIGVRAFEDCTSLTSVAIPSSVTSIGDFAFELCDSLTSITIPSSVTSIGDSAFEYCSSLTSITIPSSVTSIGNSAFDYCSSLTSITIPSSVTSIGDGAFEDCTSLTSIKVDSRNTCFSSDSYGVLFNKAKTELIQYPSGNSRASYSIPSSVTSIGDSAFELCYSLTSITIPSSVTSIGDFAFDYCDSLTSINIPSSVTSIGDYAFENCISLTSIKVDSGNTCFSSDSYGVLFNKAKTELIQYPSGNSRASYSIPSSVTSIGNWAFDDCNSLTSVTIPSSVTSIGDFAFADCDSLTSITIPSSVTSIGRYVFAYCSSLTSITIPSSVTSIGDSAFYDCRSLTDVFYSGSKAQWEAIDFGWDNDTLTKATIHYNSPMPTNSENAAVMSANAPARLNSIKAAGNAEAAQETVTKAYSGQSANTQYVFIAVIDPDADELFAADNLCYIYQKQSDASGSVSFSYLIYAEEFSESIYAMHTHVYDPVMTYATCTEQGYTTYTCKCGASYVADYVDALGHNYVDGKCTVCGEKDPDYKPPVQENPFVDVKEGSVYYNAILWAYNHTPEQITGGFDATHFVPNNPCTRAQVVTFLWRAAGCPAPASSNNPFVDVSAKQANGKDNPYYTAILWAAGSGITNGSDATHFSPNATVTRAQFVTFLWRYEQSPESTGSISGFADSNLIAKPYQKAVTWAVESGVTNGTDATHFSPNAVCTRWAVVLFMYRDMA